MPEQELTHGLRQVMVHVTLGTDFPPASNSSSDISLLRATNRALQRKAHGIDDAFLFVVAGRQDWESASATVSAYGFPGATVICIEADDLERRLEMGDETIPVEVGHEIETWLNREHIAAVARFSQDYPSAEFWWSGVEHADDVFAWPFDYGEFAKSLPASHRSRAATWLTLLGHAIELDAVQATGPENLGLQLAAAWATTLCEWLHGFEAASGNGYNHFEEELEYGVLPSDFFLGFELARLTGDDLESLCDGHAEDVDGLRDTALKAITADLRDGLRRGLSSFFGGNGPLYWALTSAIWPDYTKPMAEAMNQLLSASNHEDLAELDAPWRFVTEGWCDEAEN
jgi:hypothetical protein